MSDVYSDDDKYAYESFENDSDTEYSVLSEIFESDDGNSNEASDKLPLRPFKISEVPIQNAATRNPSTRRRFSQPLVASDTSSDEENEVIFGQTIAEINTAPMNLNDVMTPKMSGLSLKEKMQDLTAAIQNSGRNRRKTRELKEIKEIIDEEQISEIDDSCAEDNEEIGRDTTDKENAADDETVPDTGAEICLQNASEDYIGTGNETGIETEPEIGNESERAKLYATESDIIREFVQSAERNESASDTDLQEHEQIEVHENQEQSITPVEDDKIPVVKPLKGILVNAKTDVKLNNTESTVAVGNNLNKTKQLTKESIEKIRAPVLELEKILKSCTYESESCDEYETQNPKGKCVMNIRPDYKDYAKQKEIVSNNKDINKCMELLLPPASGYEHDQTAASEYDAETGIGEFGTQSEPQISYSISSEVPLSFDVDNYLMHLDLVRSKSSNDKICNAKNVRQSYSFTKDRIREIERDNRILLRKIVTQKPTYTFTPQIKKVNTNLIPSVRASSAAINRKKQQRQIDLDNLVLKRKLEAISKRKK